ncbi:MAG: PKD domain-containing protein [Bacteroidia bacterium]|nr:PKD domain-containing protein [Bacteroidia bacterium]
MKRIITLLIFSLMGWLGLQAQTACDSVQANVNLDSVCIGEPMVFTVELDSGFFQGIDSIIWDFGDGTSSNSLAVSQTYTFIGNYNVQVQIYLNDSTNPCLQTIPVVVKDVPQVNISFDTLRGCLPFIPLITNNTFSGPPGTAPSYTWMISGGTQGSHWDFLPGSNVNSPAPSIQFDSTGFYNLEVLVANDCDTILQCFQVEVLTLGVASLSIPVDTVCFGTPVSFDFSSSFMSTTVLNTGAGTFNNPISPLVFSNYNPGAYNVSFTSTNACGVSTVTGRVVVQDVPTAGLSLSSDRICEGESVIFTLNGGYPGTDSTLTITGFDTLTNNLNGSFTRTFGSGTAGTYIITYRIENACGIDEARDTLTIIAPPAPTLLRSQGVICVDSCITFSYTDTSANPGLVSSWILITPRNDTIDFTGQGNSFTYCGGDTAGTYRVSLTTENECDTIIRGTTFTVDGPPVAAVTPRTVFFGSCTTTPIPSAANDPFLFINCSAGLPSWPVCLFIDGFVSSPNLVYVYTIENETDGVTLVDTALTANYIYAFDIGDVYNVTLTVIDQTSGCQDTWGPGTFTYQATPELDIDPLTPTTVCEGDTVSIEINLTSAQITILDEIILDWGDGKRIFIGDSSMVNDTTGRFTAFNPLVDTFIFGPLVTDTVFHHTYNVDEDSSYVCAPNTLVTRYTITGTGYNVCGDNTATNEQNISIIPSPDITATPQRACVTDSIICFDVDICPFPGNYIADSVVQVYLYPNYGQFSTQRIDITLPYIVGGQRSFCFNYDSLDFGTLAPGVQLPPGNYTAGVLMTVDCGEKFVTFPYTIVDQVNPQFTVNLDSANNCLPQTVSFVNTSSSIGSAPLTYAWTINGQTGSNLPIWEFLNGTSPTDAEPVVRFNAPGDYQMIVEITGSCDVALDTFDIQVFGPPNVGLTVAPDTICLGEVVVFDTTSIFTNTTSTITFTTGPENLIPPINFPLTYTYPAAGEFTAKIVESNVCGVDSAEVPIVVKDTLQPFLVFDTLMGCVPFDVSTTNGTFVSQGENPIFRWTVDSSTVGQFPDWQYVSGDSASASPRFRFNTPGDYVVRLQIFGECDTLDFVDTVRAMTSPGGSLTPDNSTICLGSCVDFTISSDTFTNALDIGTLISGDGQTVDSLNGTFTFCYNTPGVFTPSYTISNVCGSDVSTATVTVNDEIQDSVSITPLGECVPFLVDVVNNTNIRQGTPLFYLWEVSGTLADGITPASFGSSWRFQSGSFASAVPRFQILEAGTFEVCVTVIGTCDTLRSCQIIEARDVPMITLNPTDTICVNSSLLFTATSAPNNANETNTWTPILSGLFAQLPVPTASLPGTISFTYDNPGVFVAQYTETNVCGSDAAAVTVVVNDTIHEDVTQDVTEGCTQFVVNFTNNSFAIQDSILDFDWQVFPDNGISFVSGTDSFDRSVSIQFDSIGEYVVSLVMENECDTDTLFFDVTSRRAPNISLTPLRDTICVGSCIDFSWMMDSTNAVDFITFFDGQGNQLSNPGNPINVCYPNPGEYVVFIVDSNQCGVDTAFANLVVNDSITEDVVPDTLEGCTPFVVNFINNSFALQDSILNLNWSISPATGATFEPGYTANSRSMAIRFTDIGVYQVQLVMSNQCDVDTLNFEVISRGAPNINLSPVIDTVCVTGCVDFNWTIDSTNATDFISFFDGQGNVFSPPNNPQNICYPTPGSFIPFIVDSNVCGVDTAFSSIVVNDSITEDVVPDTLEGCTPFVVNFVNNSFALQDSILNFEWSVNPMAGATFEPGYTANSRSMAIRFSDIGNFQVQLIMSNQCDVDTLTFEVISRGAPDINLSPVIDTVCVTGCLDFNWTIDSTNATDFISFFDGQGNVFSPPNNPQNICYPTPGTFIPFIVDSNVCGVDTAFSSIVVNDSIHEDVFPDTTAGCAPFAVNFTNNSFVLQGVIDSVSWTVDGDPTHYTFTGGTSNTSQAPQINFNYPRDYLVCVLMYNECDIDSLCFNISAAEAPDIQLNSSQDTLCVGNCLDFTYILRGVTGDSTNANDSIVFNSGQPGFISLINPADSFQVCYPDPGTYTAMIEVYNICGADTETVIIQVTDSIQPAVSLDVNDGCVPFTVNTTNTSNVPFGNGPTFAWTINGLTSDPVNWTLVNPTDAEPVINFISPGNYEVCVTIFGDCDTLTVCDSVIARGAPNIGLIPALDTICVTNCAQYIWTLNNTNANNSISFDDGMGGILSNPSDTFDVCYNTPGSFQPFIEVSNVCGVDTAFVDLIVNDTITENVMPDTTAGCIPFTIGFTNNSSVNQGSIDSYEWSVTSSTPGGFSFIPTNGNTSAAPQIQFTEAKAYEVQLIMNNDCDSDTLSFLIEGRGAPTVDLLPSDTTICIDESILFDWAIQTTNSIDSLTFFDGLGNVFPNPGANDRLVDFDQVGNYTPRVQIENVCGIAIDSSNVEVRPLPVVSAGPDLEICSADGCINITGISPAGGVFRGLGITDSLLGTFCPEIVLAGTYEVIYSFNDGLCTGSDTMSITVFPSPKAAFAIVDGDSVCGAPATFSLLNLSTEAVDYSWDFGNGTPANSTDRDPQVEFTAVGSYPIILSISDSNGCTAEARDTAFVIPQPEARLEVVPTEGCAPLEVTFINLSTDATTAILDVDISDNQPGVPIGNSLSFNYIEPMMYTARLIVGYENFCFDTLEVMIDAAGGTLADFETILTGDSCAGPLNARFVNNSTDAVAYLWDFGVSPQETSTDENPSFSYTDIGEYVVTLVTFHQFGCTDTARDTINIYPQPEALFAQDTVGCQPLTVNFRSLSNDNVTSWLWDFGNGDSSTEANPAYVFEEEGSYNITLTVGYNEVCFDELTGFNQVTVRPTPTAAFIASDTATNGVNTGTISFTNLSTPLEGLRYFWNFGDPSSNNNTSISRNPSHTYEVDQDYNVSLIVVNEFGCRDTTIDVVNPEGFGDLFIPNAFIPRSGDPYHNIFQPIGVGLREFHIQVFDPLGELIWESTALENGKPSEWWDGTKNGVLMSPDAYMWVVKRAVFQSGRRWDGMIYESWQKPSRYGTVTLID